MVSVCQNAVSHCNVYKYCLSVCDVQQFLSTQAFGLQFFTYMRCTTFFFRLFLICTPCSYNLFLPQPVLQLLPIPDLQCARSGPNDPPTITLNNLLL